MGKPLVVESLFKERRYELCTTDELFGPQADRMDGYGLQKKNLTIRRARAEARRVYRRGTLPEGVFCAVFVGKKEVHIVWRKDGKLLRFGSLSLDSAITENWHVARLVKPTSKESGGPVLSG